MKWTLECVDVFIFLLYCIVSLNINSLVEVHIFTQYLLHEVVVAWKKFLLMKLEKGK